MEEHIIELEEEVLGHHVGAEEDAAGEHHTAIDVKRLWRAQNQPETFRPGEDEEADEDHTADADLVFNHGELLHHHHHHHHHGDAAHVKAHGKAAHQGEDGKALEDEDAHANRLDSLFHFQSFHDKPAPITFSLASKAKLDHTHSVAPYGKEEHQDENGVPAAIAAHSDAAGDMQSKLRLTRTEQQEMHARAPELLHFSMNALAFANLRQGEAQRQKAHISKVHIDVLTGQCYNLRVDGVRIASGNQFELAAELQRALVKGTRISIKSPAGSSAPRPGLYVSSFPVAGIHTPFGSIYDVFGHAVWVDFDSILANDGPHLMPASEDAVAGSVALFHWVHHKQSRRRIEDNLHRIHQCFKALASAVILVCPALPELAAAEDETDAAARMLFGANFGEVHHNNNIHSADKLPPIPVWLVSNTMGKCIGGGEEVQIKKWAHSLLVAQGTVTKFQDIFVDKYSPHAVEGSKVSTSYTFQIKIDAEDPIALRANSTIEFLDLPTGVFLKPGGIWVNRLPAYTEPVEATAKRYLQASIERFKIFGTTKAFFCGTSAHLLGTTEQIEAVPAIKGRIIRVKSRKVEEPVTSSNERLKHTNAIEMTGENQPEKKELSSSVLDTDAISTLETSQVLQTVYISKRTRLQKYGLVLWKKIKPFFIIALFLALLGTVTVVPIIMINGGAKDRGPNPFNDTVAWQPPSPPAPFPAVYEVPHVRFESVFEEVVEPASRRVAWRLPHSIVRAPDTNRPTAASNRRAELDASSVTAVAVADILEEVECGFQCLISRPNYGCRAMPGGVLPEMCLRAKTYDMLGHVHVALRGGVSGATEAVETTGNAIDKLFKRNVTLDVFLAVADLSAAASVLETTRTSKIKQLMQQQLIDLGVATGTEDGMVPELVGIDAVRFVNGTEEVALGLATPPPVICNLALLTAPGNGSKDRSDAKGTKAVGEMTRVRCNAGFQLAPPKLPANASAPLPFTIGAEDGAQGLQVECREDGSFAPSPFCEPCAPGFFQGVSDDASAKCLPCAAGKFNGLTSASACIDCPQHFFSPGTLDGAPAVGCTRCDVEGYTTTPGVAAVSRDNCVVCDAGFEGELSTGCIPCPAGTYTESIGFGKCIACPEGSTTQARLFSVEDCICRPGYTRFASAAKSRMCRPCPLNTYKPSIGDAACTACPALTEESAQSGIKESIDTCVCVPGASRNLTESAPPLDVCTECPAGKIKASVGPAACMQCMEGLYSASALSTSCTACMPGYYSSIQGATGCKQCSIGKYAEGSGSSSCIVCEAGYFAEAIASPACARCPAGKYSGEPESSFCIACSYGTYAGSKGMTSCRECAAGTFATVMKTICENCTAGHYSKAAMSTCLFCQAGKYQDSMGQTACKECGPGRHTSSVEASDGCPECEAGSFSEGSTYQCTECAVGTYQALEAASTCKACAPGAATQSAGASSIEACKCMPGQTGDYPPFLTPDGTCFYGFWAQGVKYDLEETSLSPHWTLCLEVPYHSPTTLVDLKCGAGGACNEHAVCGTGGKVLVGFRRRGSSSLGAAAMGTTRAKTATADDVFNPILAPSPQEDGANATRLHNHVWWYTTPASFGFSAEKEVQLDEQDVSTSTCAGRVGWALSGAGGFRAGCTCSGCSDDKDLSGSVDGSEFLKVVYWAP